MKHVVILDQFVGPSPYQLQQEPMSFADLVSDVRAHPEDYTTTMGHRPEVKEVPDDYRPVLCTTVFAADEQGNAFAWRYNWDSSG